MVTYVNGITVRIHLCHAFCKKVKQNSINGNEILAPYVTYAPTAARSVYKSSVTPAQLKVN
jgi:hypothetical protein